MALDKIRLANKKARRNAKRKAVRNDIAAGRQRNKISRQRTQKMMIQGRREYFKKRRDDKDYIDRLEAEING